MEMQKPRKGHDMLIHPTSQKGGTAKTSTINSAMRAFVKAQSPASSPTGDKE